MCTPSWGTLSLLRRWRAWTMLSAPDLMSACIGCISPCWSCIQISRAICDEPSLVVPTKYTVHMRASGLSDKTLSLNEIQCSWLSSGVAIKVHIPNDCNPSPDSSILFCGTWYWKWLARFLVADCQRSAGIRFVFRLLEEQGFEGRWRMYISCTWMFEVWVTHIVSIFHPTSECHSALPGPKAWEWIYNPCPTWTCQASVIHLAWVWMVGNLVPCCLVEMMLLTASAVDMTATVDALCHQAKSLNRQHCWKALPCWQSSHSLGSTAWFWT